MCVAAEAKMYVVRVSAPCDLMQIDCMHFVHWWCLRRLYIYKQWRTWVSVRIGGRLVPVKELLLAGDIARQNLPLRRRREAFACKKQVSLYERATYIYRKERDAWSCWRM